MNTHDKYELPPHAYAPDHYIWYSRELVEKIRQEAIEADRERQYRPVYEEGWKDALEWASKRRGEPVGYLVELDGRDTYVSADRTVRDAHLTYGWRPVYAAPQPDEPWKHDLYQTGDPGAPEQIKDGNNEVVLGLCKRCGKAEIELSEPCSQQPAEPAARSDKQIVDQTEELARLLMLEFYSREAPENTLFRNADNPRGEHVWRVACQAQEMLTATDPENSVAEIDEDPHPAEPVKVPSKLSNAEIMSLAYDVGAVPEQATDASLVRFARALLERYGQQADPVNLASPAPKSGIHPPEIQAAWHSGWEAARDATTAEASMGEAVKPFCQPDPQAYFSALRKERDDLMKAASAAGFSFIKHVDGSVQMVPVL